jgi:glucan biosynthesis protein C
MTRALLQPSVSPSSFPPPASGERRSRPPPEPASPPEVGTPVDARPSVAPASGHVPQAGDVLGAAPKPAERVHHLDFLRASMMILGVFVHASHADYDLGRYQAIRFVSGSFRMACFFLISGYFSAAMLDRYTDREFLRRRLLALGVPAVFSVLVLNPPALRAMQHYFATAPVAIEPVVNWHLHVWFLFVLMIYSLAARPLLRVCQAAAGVLGRLSRVQYGEALGLALLTAVASVALKALEKWGTALPAFDQYSEISCSAVENLPYFACGLLMQRVPRVFRFAHARPWFWGVVALGLLGPRWWLEQQAITTTLQHLLHLAMDFTTAFACSFALLSVAERWVRRPRRWVTLTAASAYTIYIVHYLFISLTLLHTQRWGFPQPLRAVTAALVALGAGYAIHFACVERVPLVALLLNGRLARRKRPAVAVGAKALPGA